MTVGESAVLLLQEHIGHCQDCSTGGRAHCIEGSLLTELALDEEIDDDEPPEPVMLTHDDDTLGGE